MTNPGTPNLPNDDTAERAFVRADGNATLVCPQCNSVKIVPVMQYKERQHRLQVRCACAHVFKINLDFRQCYRKVINLTGIYALKPPAVGGGMVRIHNISLSGICFEVTGVHQIQLGQKGRIDFTLDNKKETRLIREFTVRSVSGAMIGCEFTKEQQFEKELGFYLRFGP
jgi:hypothetical protein